METICIKLWRREDTKRKGNVTHTFFLGGGKSRLSLDALSHVRMFCQQILFLRRNVCVFPFSFLELWATLFFGTHSAWFFSTGEKGGKEEEEAFRNRLLKRKRRGGKVAAFVAVCVPPTEAAAVDCFAKKATFETKRAVFKAVT